MSKTWSRSTSRLLLLALAVPSISIAQGSPAPVPRPPDDTQKTFFVRQDLYWSGAALAVTAAISPFDVRIARWTQTPSVQGSSSRHQLVSNLTKVNESTVIGASLITYGIGRLAGSPTLADVGLHVAEANILTSVIGQTIRGPLGRARPSVSPDDQYHFQFGRGFTHFDNRSFPSLHSAAGFAAAAAAAAEIHERNPSASWWAAPILFTVATIPGLTRLYLNEHWTSDILAGSFLGTLIGTRVVHYAHTHRPSKLDRVMLGIGEGSRGEQRLKIGLTFGASTPAFLAP